MSSSRIKEFMVMLAIATIAPSLALAENERRADGNEYCLENDQRSEATCVFCDCETTITLATGGVEFTKVDLATPCRGQLGFIMARVFASHLEYTGPLGPGWDFLYNEQLKIATNGDVTRWTGKATDQVFVKSGSDYISPTGNFCILTKDSGSGEYTYREPDGFKRVFDSTGVLLSHEDRNGNEMTFTHNGSGELSVVTDP